MRYKKFIIENYRAISGPLEINIDRKSLMPIIGINESGKTTILQAIFSFDYYNDDLNDKGKHLSDTTNLYRTAAPPANVIAYIEVDRADLNSAIDDYLKEQHNPALEVIRKKRTLPHEIIVARNLVTSQYSILTAPFNNKGIEDSLARKIIVYLPYTLYFDDFRDKVEEKIEIVGKKDDRHSGWLAILERLFERTDKQLSVFDLATMEDRQRKSALAKVTRRLNETLTQEWQNFRLDDRDALAISIEFISEVNAKGDPVNFLKLDIVETDLNGDRHYFFISDRSKGFYWFFNFVMKLEFNPKILSGNEGNTVYLLDEPGSYLHASAQSKLCLKLRQLAESNRVIYCTHSHYLLDPEVISLSSITVADKDGNGNVTLTPLHAYRGGIYERRSAFQPVMDALRIKPFIMDLTNARVVITEGMHDYYCLEMFKQGRPISVLPSVNADSVKFYISLMIAWQVKYRALWDNDDEGRRRFEESAKIFGNEVKVENLRLIPTIANQNKRILQDLFSGEDIRMFKEELFLSPDCSFDKVIPALFYSPRRNELLQKVTSTTRTNFDSLFESLRFI